MKTLKSVDSVIKPSFARHLKACNNYAKRLVEKYGCLMCSQAMLCNEKNQVDSATLTEKSSRDSIKLKVITIITKHDIWLKQAKK